MSYINIFGGSTVQPSNVSLNTITLDQDKALSWPTQFLDTPNVLGGITQVNPNADGHTLTLPDATLASVGMVFLLVNISPDYSFVLENYNEDTLSGDYTGTNYVYLADNTTSAGDWRFILVGTELPSFVTQVGAAAATNGLTIVGDPSNPITSSGTFYFSLSDNLVELSDLDDTGFVVRNDDDPDSFTLRSLVAGPNILITNTDGVLGNPLISLNTILTALTSIAVGNLNLTNNILSTTGNADLQLSPDGDGTVRITKELDAGGEDITDVGTLQVGTISTTSNADLILEPNGTGVVQLNKNLDANARDITNVTTLEVGDLELTGNTIRATGVANLVLEADPGAIVLDGDLNADSNDITNVNSLTAGDLTLTGTTISSSGVNSINVAPGSGVMTLGLSSSSIFSLKKILLVNSTEPSEIENAGYLYVNDGILYYKAPDGSNTRLAPPAP